MRSITLKRQQSTVKTKLPCHHWKHNMFLLFFFSNLHKTLGAVRFLLICSYFVPLSWSQTCFVLFCTLVMITDMFCIILYPCHNHRHVLYYCVPLSWSQTCFVLFCTLVIITDMFCIILYPCHDHRHALYYFVPLS